MSRGTVLVCGWYGCGNVGDELMKNALRELFFMRNLSTRFVSRINDHDLRDIVGVVIGGGSILSGAPNISAGAMQTLMKGEVPLFYIGVGPETDVHISHRALLNTAKVVKYRELDMPDLAYSLRHPETIVPEFHQSILCVPNVECVPTSASQHWVHIAWERFKDEAAQALDHMIDQGVEVSFMLMCSNSHMEDAWAAHELIARMKRRGWKKQIKLVEPDHVGVCAFMQNHGAIMTQRYHGIVLSEMSGVPYVAIDHHDKLKNAKPNRGQHLSFNGCTKSQLIEALESALSAPRLSPHRVSFDTYDRIIDEVIGFMELEDGD